MAQNKKIIDLPLLTTTADEDLFIIEDVSVPQTAKIPYSTIKAELEFIARSEAARTAAQAVENAGKYIAADPFNRPFTSLSALQTGNHYYNGGQIDNTTAYQLAQNDFALVKDDANNTYIKYVYQSNNWESIATYSQAVSIYDILDNDQLDAVNSGIDAAWKLSVDNGIYQKQTGLTSIYIKDNDETNSQYNSVSRTDNSFDLKLPATIKADLSGNATTATKATLSDKSILAGIFYSTGIPTRTASFRYIEASNGYGAAGRPTLNNGDTFLLYIENAINPLLSSDALNGTFLHIEINDNQIIQTSLYSTRRMPEGLYFLRYNSGIFLIGAASLYNLENGTQYKTLSALTDDDLILSLKIDTDTNAAETYRLSPATLKTYLSGYYNNEYLQKSNDLSDLSNKNSAIRYLTESATTLPSGAANSVKIPVTDNGMGGSLTLSDIFTFYGLANTNGTLTYTGNATNDENGDQISTTYAKTNDVLLKSNNLSDLQSTDTAISNLIGNAQTSGVYSSSAKFLIKNNIPSSNATGSATIGDLLSYLKNQLYTEYSGTATLTKSSGVELTDKDFRNHYIEIVITGSKSNNTILASYAVQTTQSSGGSWRIPFQWYNGSAFESHYLILSINSSSMSIKISGIDAWTSQAFNYYIKVWN